MSRLATPYPNYDVLAKQQGPSWDDTTRRVITKRLTQVPSRRFFSQEEWELLEAVCARLVPQPDRSLEPVPIVPWVDEKLYRNEGDGYRYEEMPPMRDAWRLGLEGVQREAQSRHDVGFALLAVDRQDEILAAIQCGDVTAATWQRLPPKRFFRNLLLNTVVAIYYSHPFAWSESGFGGPASPRGYVRLEADRRDAWEAKQHDR